MPCYMKLEPIPNEPALLLKTKKNVLILADLHIGIESELKAAGINIPSCILPEVEIFIGQVPLAEYDTPGGKDFAETKRKLMKVSSRRLAWRGTVLLETGKPEAAAPQFKAALVTDPGNAEAMKGLALCHEALGKKDEARKCWGAYIKTGPEEEDLKLAREHLEKLKE